MTNILVLDNYDSFTYNLVHLIEKAGNYSCYVFKNDEIELSSVNNFDKIVLSPGPGIPDEAGLLKPLIKEYARHKSILGVCLGHQAIAEVFGASLVNLDTVYHGVTTAMKILDSGNPLFKNLNIIEPVGRYHSWCVSDENFPDELTITAIDENGHIMGLRHNMYDVQGVQFHPESVLTPCGEKMLKNWLND